MNDKCKDENKCIEYIKKIIGLIFGGITFLIMMFNLKISFININDKKEVLSNLINFISISTGFLMTTLSILVAASNSRVMKKLAKYKKIKQLNMFFVEPIIVSIILVIFSIIEIGMNKTCIIEKTISALIIALSLNYILDFCRIGFLCINILQEIMDENFREDKKEKSIPVDVEKAFIHK